jgi:hypothetical protein
MSLPKRIINISVQLKDGTLVFIDSVFRISFSIKKTGTSDKNTCTLQIYNLSKETRNVLNIPGSLLTVNAGYDNAETIFVGNIYYTTSKKSYPDIIFVIEAKDGEDALELTRDSVSFKEGVSIKQILKAVQNKFKIALKTDIKKLIFDNKSYGSGFCFTGKLKGLLDTICKDANLQWSVQNNQLKFYNNRSLDYTTTIYINQDTGMINSPERIKISKGEKTDKVEIDGICIVSLLQPKAEPGGVIEVSSEEIGEKKQFKIDTVEHSGDNFDGDFQSTIEAVEIVK